MIRKVDLTPGMRESDNPGNFLRLIGHEHQLARSIAPSRASLLERSNGLMGSYV